MEQTNYDLSALIKNWPSPIVAREEVGKFSGGLLNPRTMANQDAKKTGPAGKINMGRKVGYDVRLLVEWMQARINDGNAPVLRKKAERMEA